MLCLRLFLPLKHARTVLGSQPCSTRASDVSVLTCVLTVPCTKHFIWFRWDCLPWGWGLGLHMVATPYPATYILWSRLGLNPSIRQSRFSESVLLLHHFLTKSTSDPRVSAQALEFSSAALLKHACAHKSPGGLIKMQMVMEMWRSRFLKAPRCCCCYLSTRIWWCFFSCERSLQSRVIIFWSSLFLTDWYGLFWIIIIINTNRIFGL